MADASHEVHGSEADPAGEALLVVDPVTHHHLLSLEDLSPAPWAPVCVPKVGLDLQVGIGVHGQRGVRDLGVANPAVDLVIKAHKHLSEKKNQDFFSLIFLVLFFFANLQLVVLGPVALGALEAPLVVGLSLLDHLLGVEHRTPATRAPGLGTTIAGPAVLNQLGAAADRRGLDATGLDQGGVGVDLGTVVPDE